MRACLGIQRWVEGQPIPLTACLQGGDARIPDSATASHAMTVWHACRRRCAVALPDAAAAGGVAGGAHAAPAHPGCARRPGAPTLAPALTGCLHASVPREQYWDPSQTACPAQVLAVTRGQGKRHYRARKASSLWRLGPHVPLVHQCFQVGTATVHPRSQQQSAVQSSAPLLPHGHSHTAPDSHQNQ